MFAQMINTRVSNKVASSDTVCITVGFAGFFEHRGDIYTAYMLLRYREQGAQRCKQKNVYVTAECTYQQHNITLPLRDD